MPVLWLKKVDLVQFQPGEGKLGLASARLRCSDPRLGPSDALRP